MVDKPSINSSASQPDLDWSQVRETVLMLNLATAQIEFSLKDGTASVDALTESFTQMADTSQKVNHELQQLFADYGIDEKHRQALEQHSRQVAEKIQQVVMAFQFYDTLVQRLDHVVLSLSHLAELVSEPQRLYSPEAWCDLQAEIRRQYNMREERELFDAIIAGEAMELVLEKMQQVAAQQQEDIELF